ncbi:MAG: hypothetical protein ABIF01_02495 [Candidatus Micrarchaeota archaeon]
MNDKPENPISKDSGSPLWKRFMVTDIMRVERVSGEIHSRAQPVDEGEIGLFSGKEKFVRVEAKAHEESKKADVYHEPEPEPMPKPEIEGVEFPKEPSLFAREVFMKPLLPFGVEEKEKNQTLPSRSGDLLFGFRNPGSRIGRSGILISKMKGLNDPKEKNGEG